MPIFKKTIFCMTFLTVLICASCGGGDSGGVTPASLNPILKNLAINFSDFDLTILANEDRKPFLPFGGVLTATQLNPTFEFYLKFGSDIISPVDGVIADVHFRSDSNDYTVSITPQDTNDWSLFLDHVLTPVVAVGTIVAAGDAIGKAGMWDENLGRTELQLYNNTDFLSYCPMNYLDSSVASGLEAEITNLMNEWEALESDPNAYDESAMSPPGCLTTSIEG
ncbi:MAG: hypothetical protein ABIE74_12810 [Pseudomonadota bacterium]